ncbi:hypothetical protein BT67DRAFT_414833 [Trichocladium antarcticum]|uniref:Ribosomal protein L34 n=1 Tax=Trichocladium antarcticum TaxID=1450529 RepID=A0AAN6URP7_9PEZI|nr:hypothetical protein BT67DRAFT_414833 [Trichocladium antarcticum]
MQSPLLQAALRRPTAQLLPRCVPTTTPATKPAAARTFSHLPTLRPSLSARASIFRAPTATATTTGLFTPTAGAAGGGEEGAAMAATGLLDLVPKSAISAHPALGHTQIRCGPRATMSGHSRLIQKRRHGFLSRAKSPTGKKMLLRRRAKNRKRLSA